MGFEPGQWWVREAARSQREPLDLEGFRGRPRNEVYLREAGNSLPSHPLIAVLKKQFISLGILDPRNTKILPFFAICQSWNAL